MVEKDAIWRAAVYAVEYTSGMNDQSSAQSLLEQAAKIGRLERGKLSILRQGASGPFYNHQFRKAGKNVSRYVPRDQVEAVQEAIDGYAKFQALIERYVDQRVESTRQEIARDSKKNFSRQRPGSSSRRNKKSSG